MDNVMAASDPSVSRIVAVEWEMKLATQCLATCCSAETPDAALEDKQAFLAQRAGRFMAFSDETRESYYSDLMRALDGGRNLVVERQLNLMIIQGYDFGDNLSGLLPTPNEEESTLIRELATKLTEQMAALAVRYPALTATLPIRKVDETEIGNSFESEQEAELRTYTMPTLLLFKKDIESDYQQESFAYHLLDCFAKACGFVDIDQAEKAFAAEA